MPDETFLAIPLVIRIKVPGENYFVAIPVTDEKIAEKIYSGRASMRDILNYLRSAMSVLPESDKIRLETILQFVEDWERSGTSWQVAIVSEEGGRVVGEIATYTPDTPIPEAHVIRKRTEEGLEINALDISLKPIERGGIKPSTFFTKY